MQTPWQAPPGFTIQPDPRSRFCDPTPIDDPRLPVPAPQLYAYRLPALMPHDPARFQGTTQPLTVTELPRLIACGATDVQRLPPIAQESAAIHDPFVRQAAYQQGDPAGGSTDVPADLRLRPLDANAPVGANEDPVAPEYTVVPIPGDVWQSLPPNCLTRMFEFNSVREEYERTFHREPSAQQRDHSPRLALEDIVELALINSREYQAQKETLYRTALRLSLERFDYDLKFSTGGNGTATTYRHSRNAGITDDHLTVPTTVTGDKVLATGGDLLARFANDVVLTFNGPSGFAADIGSELLLDISQSVLQRDVVFERLTQAERDVVYAARDFARFRKELFRDLASSYYGLILNYRGIEISTQDYFSNLRAFNQREAEYRAGQRSRIEVDQVEQDALSSRSSLIGRCNSLESGLDDLKRRVGLPPELPLNLDLTELEVLTLRDEVTVSGERIRRARRNLLSERQKPAPDRSVLLNGSVDLAQKMLDLMELRRRLGYEQPEEESLQRLRVRLSADEMRSTIRSNRVALDKDRNAQPPKPPVQVFQRARDLVESLLRLVELELELAERSAADLATIEQLRRDLVTLDDRFERLRLELDETVARRDLDRIPQIVLSAEALLADVEVLTRRADALAQYQPIDPAAERLETLAQVDELLASGQHILREETGGLTPVEIGMDDAMLTALVRRFDLMNGRGELADFWRRIKLAGDDLKSVLNLNATQAIRTRSGMNRPFDFTFDDSETRLSMTFDTPLNRKSQRNAYRETLINYNAGLRNLMQLEDDIKRSIRNDLRDLQLDREQYAIAVASAALAYERVVSTQLQLKLGVPGVAARDFLEAQRAYTASLNSVASQHIGYILDRIQLFLDLEWLEVDDRGFWPELYNEQYEPVADFRFRTYACSAYGDLPRGVCYSRGVRQMFCVPTGSPTVHKEQADPAPQQTAAPELLPAPQPEPVGK
ncbi:MAG: TolC family protein [Pirellulales bacterium]|nr:TolC family protein [Pirellulales bacterium]